MLWLLLLPAVLGGDSVRLDFEPPSGLLVRETENATFSFVVKGAANGTSLRSARFVVADPEIATVDAELLDLSGFSIGDGANHSVLMHGLFVGKSDVKIYILTADGTTFETTYYVGAMRSEMSGALTSGFVIIATLITFVNNALMGIQLDRRSIWAIVKKPVAPAIGFACQWLCMAPLAAGWASLILTDAAQQFGLFLVGCCPGGGQSNKFALLLDGDLDLSITLTFFSSIIALGMMPAWVYSLGTIFSSRLGLGGAAISIPFQQIAISLGLAVGPALVGMAIRHAKPHWQAKTLTMVKWTSFLVVIVFMPFAIATNLYIFSYFTWRPLLAGLALPTSGFLIGLGSGYAARQGYAKAITLAIETSIQNVQIAMFVLRFALPEPDRDLVLVVPVCFMIFAALPIWLILLTRTILKCVRRCRGEKEEEAAEDPDPSPWQIVLCNLIGICGPKDPKTAVVSPQVDLEISKIMTKKKTDEPSKTEYESNEMVMGTVLHKDP